MVKPHFLHLWRSRDGALCPGPRDLETGGAGVSTDPTAPCGPSALERAWCPASLLEAARGDAGLALLPMRSCLIAVAA